MLWRPPREQRLWWTIKEEGDDEFFSWECGSSGFNKPDEDRRGSGNEREYSFYPLLERLQEEVMKKWPDRVTHHTQGTNHHTAVKYVVQKLRDCRGLHMSDDEDEQHYCAHWQQPSAVESFMCELHEAGKRVPHYYTIEDLQEIGSQVVVEECVQFQRQEAKKRDRPGSCPPPRSLNEVIGERRRTMRPSSRERIDAQIQAAADQAEVDRAGSFVSCKRKFCFRRAWNDSEGELCCKTCLHNPFLEKSFTIFGQKREDGNKEWHGPECKKRWVTEWKVSAYPLTNEHDERTWKKTRR